MPTQHARRALDRHGQDVTFRTWTQTGTNARERPQHSTTETTVTARLHLRRSADKITDAHGDERTAVGDVFVKDTVSVPTDPPKAAEFDIDGVTYEVLIAEDQDNGLVRCVVARVR